ncbi:hypothetical protein KI387_040666, partial [Taxus chinensis]
VQFGRFADHYPKSPPYSETSVWHLVHLQLALLGGCTSWLPFGKCKCDSSSPSLLCTESIWVHKQSHINQKDFLFADNMVLK